MPGSRAGSARPEDIVRTPGSESNVKEIYDKCAELGARPGQCDRSTSSPSSAITSPITPAPDRPWRASSRRARARRPGLRPAVFVAASGSAGTLAAGDYLKEKHGARIVAVEASECPTLLRNGFGEHNIQGIGDKHVPLIHNVMNTDLVVGVSDRSTGSARPVVQQRHRAAPI